MKESQYWYRAGLCEFAQRSQLILTASALNGVPSWNVTPWRSLKVHVSPSGETDQLVARSGSMSVLPGTARTSKLKICVVTSYVSPFVLVGLSRESEIGRAHV